MSHAPRVFQLILRKYIYFGVLTRVILWLWYIIKRRRLNTVKLYNHVECYTGSYCCRWRWKKIYFVKCKVSVCMSIIRLYVSNREGIKKMNKKEDVYKYLHEVCQAEVKWATSAIEFQIPFSLCVFFVFPLLITFSWMRIEIICLEQRTQK